jgi:signal transduction histidine kinase/ActR/RegA family two-component response regulator/uncharacterized membrane protein affecting hemolysin expression
MQENQPIRRKLIKIILLTSGLVLLLNCAILFGYQYFSFRQIAARNLTTLAQVIAANSTAALAFDNVDDAQTILTALKAEPQITAAGLYDSDGTLFAKYPESLKDTALPRTLKNTDIEMGVRFVNSQLVAYQLVAEHANNPLGVLYLQSNMQWIYTAFQLYGAIVVLVILASLLVAYLISNQLQQQVSQPILALAETATAISQRSDYSVRAAKASGHEFGLLTDAFNHMLTRIQGQLRNLDLLQRITRAIAERQDLPSIFKVVVRSLEDSMPIDYGCICLHDPLTDMLTVVSVGERSSTINAAVGLIAQTSIPVGKNGLSRCVRGTLVYEADIKTVRAEFPERLARAGLGSVVLAPLLVESKVFGILVAARCQPESFSSGDCEFLKQLSEHVALAAHQAQLHGALQQAYDDLHQSQHTVMQQERLRALGQMASGIAHDINNAISPVALYTESLLEREPNLSERSRSYLISIRQAIEDVAHTVARMREFYRHREQQLVLAAVDLNQLAEQVVGMTRARWSDVPQESGIFIDLKTEFAPELPKIMGAESEIRDALTNLIFNAVDAMPSGGRLTIRTRTLIANESRPDMPATTSVSVEVSDTGVGMDTETRQRCLEPFFTTKGERGTGLGLAMVYGMVQRHSADLEIDSSQGNGTTMRLVFAASVPQFTGTAYFPSVSKPTQRLRILIVDDDPMLIKALRDTLEADGHIVTAADGGQAGIDAFATAAKHNESFTAVITDLGMPYVDGRKVAATIKGQSPNTRVIMLTGWGQRLLDENDIPPHVDQVLSKPPRIHELRAALAVANIESVAPVANRL